MGYRLTIWAVVENAIIKIINLCLQLLSIHQGKNLYIRPHFLRGYHLHLILCLRMISADEVRMSPLYHPYIILPAEFFWRTDIQISAPQTAALWQYYCRRVEMIHNQ